MPAAQPAKIKVESAVCALLCLLSAQAAAEISLPALISDHMVLQQHQRPRLWGQATPGTTIQAAMAGRTASALTDSQGNWQLYLPQLPAGQYNLTLSEQFKQQTLSSLAINDVAVGEVWLAAGQSNMEWSLAKSAHYEQALASITDTDTDLRFFVVSHQTALQPQTDVNGYWIKVDTENAAGLSGIAFHFAHLLHQKTNTPIGIIQSAWGSTKAEAWTPLAAMQNHPELSEITDELERQLGLPAAEKAVFSQQQLDWEANNYLQDPGISPTTQAYATVGFNAADWPETQLPALFSDLQFFGDGAIWFRREFTLTPKQSAQDAVLHLGMIDDFDQVFLNGEEVAQTDRNTAHHWLQPRRYLIPAKVLQAGRNTLAIRVFDQYGDGGFTSRAQDMYLKTGAMKLPLAGTWQYQISVKQPAMQADWTTVPTPLYGLQNRNTPATLYNAMVAPLTPYTLQGVIWYQGESDAKQPERYRVLFPTLIREWRQAWQQNLPFLLVQLANFNLPEDNSQQLWAQIREIQADTARQIPGTGMVSAIDAGEADSIHPANKKIIGERLANLALATVYGLDTPWQHPRCEQAAWNASQQSVILKCSTASGLQSKGEITAFELAGEDGRFYPATASIAGDTLVLSADTELTPTTVRYAWANNPQANVYSSDGLPLLPFTLPLSGAE